MVGAKPEKALSSQNDSPIKFEFDNFTTVTFYRPSYPLGSSIELSKSDINFSKKLGGVLGVKIKELLQILHHTEKDYFL